MSKIASKKNILYGKIILVTGGTGSFGKAFIKEILTNYKPKAVRIYSRDELKQWEMQEQFDKYRNSKFLRFLIGDVRDSSRLERACEGVDIIIHAAALKQVPTAEYNPMECIKTNIFGAENVINAALNCGVKKVIALSTDKAAAPINLYGASKLCSDKLFVAANNMRGKHKITFSVVRYGNVMGSRGSVIPFFLEKRKEGIIPITHPEMTRFNITLDEAVHLVLYALENTWGGEIFVPKLPSYKVIDLAMAICPKGQHKIIGIRPGEKLHEEMITETDALNTLEFPKHYIIAPNTQNWSLNWSIKGMMSKFKAKHVAMGFKYSSGQNSKWLSVENLRLLIQKHIDSNFKIG